MFDDKLNENNEERNSNELSDNENSSLEEEMKAENHFYDGYEKNKSENMRAFF